MDSIPRPFSIAQMRAPGRSWPRLPPAL